MIHWDVHDFRVSRESGHIHHSCNDFHYWYARPSALDVKREAELRRLSAALYCISFFYCKYRFACGGAGALHDVPCRAVFPVSPMQPYEGQYPVPRLLYSLRASPGQASATAKKRVSR